MKSYRGAWYYATLTIKIASF